MASNRSTGARLQQYIRLRLNDNKVISVEPAVCRYIVGWNLLELGNDKLTIIQPGILQGLGLGWAISYWKEIS